MGNVTGNRNADAVAAPALDSAAVEALCVAIAHRRSLGGARLSPDPVAPHLIQRALEAADWAPSHGDTEPWRFTVYTGHSRHALGEAFAQAYRSDAERGGVFKESVYQAQRERALASPVWISIGMQPALRPEGCQACKLVPLPVDTLALLVERALLDPSVRVRRVAVHQLGLQEQDPRAIEALNTLLDRETDAKLLSRAHTALANQQARRPGDSGA
jgi:nitroreductase